MMKVWELLQANVGELFPGAKLNDLVVREIMNGMLFLLGACLCVAMGMRLLRRMKEDGWYDDEGTQATIALFVFLVGDGIRSAWIWALLSCQNEFGRSGCISITNSYLILISASAFAIVGATCCIRVFTPAGWRPWTWVGAGICSVVIPLTLYLI